MSDRQREIRARIEAILAARNRGGWEALFAEIDPDAEWEPIAEAVVYRGRDSIAEYFAGWDEAWAELRIDVDGNFYTVWELRKGRVLRCREYAHEGEAQAEFERRR